MSRTPVIGITATPSEDVFDHGTFRRYALSNTYVNAVRAAGGIPIILPPGETDLQAVLDAVDGLIFSGGSDFDPSLYGETEVHETTYGIDPERDSYELALMNLAYAQDKPFLGICRGIQTMNVALGGTLIQDVPSSIGAEIEHRQQALGKTTTDTSHQVTVTEGSVLADIVGDTTVSVNSYHHQSVGRPAPAVEVIATSSDGAIESIVAPDRHFALGVQWHPEMLAAGHDEHLALFRALVEACQEAPVTAG
ncbi:MAG: gamma-glutamyl-gamma-aminobutyrate hydrolase family protein [Thermomicrobiales bacterium]